VVQRAAEAGRAGAEVVRHGAGRLAAAGGAVFDRRELEPGAALGASGRDLFVLNKLKLSCVGLKIKKVTRLGEFSYYLLREIILKITEVAQIFGYFTPR
jgi:hypothetical protein